MRDDLHKRLAQAHEGLNFRIERAGAGELPRFELKAKRTIDLRDVAGGRVGMMTVDLLGIRADRPPRQRLLAVYEELKALCARGPAAERRTRTCAPRWR